MNVLRSRYTVKEVAFANAVNPNTVYAMVYAGELEAVRIGRSIRLESRALESAGLAIPELEAA